MPNLTTVLAGLVFVVAQSSVQGSKLTKLIALELILALGYGRGGFNHVVDQLLGLVDLLLGVGHDETMQVLLLVAGVSCVGATLAFFHRAFSANGNLGTGL